MMKIARSLPLLSHKLKAGLTLIYFYMGGGSKKFSKLYPPLLNPEQIDYYSSDPALCWILNLPLPNTFDFIVFGSHAASLHSAVPAFMGICGVYNIYFSRDAINPKQSQNFASQNTNRQNYIDIFKALLQTKQIKDKFGYKKCYLQLSDFLLDDDVAKFYALLPQKDALLVTRDPISALKAMCHVQNRPQFMLLGGELFGAGVNFSISAKDYFDKNLKYTNKFTNDKYKPKVASDKELFSDLPSINDEKIKWWLLDRAQSFHDGQVFALLKERLLRVKIKLTSDFVNAKETMRDLSEFFGFDYNESPLFCERVSDLKYFTPLKIYTNENMPFFDEINEPLSSSTEIDAQERMRISKEQAKSSIILHLSSIFDKRVYISKNRGKIASGEITEYFDGIEKHFVVFLENPTLRTQFLANQTLLNKAQKYILLASHDIYKKAQNEKTKHLKESDILDFLAKNTELRALCAAVFNVHLSFLREYKPEIIETFKHYNHFAKLCVNDEQIEFCDEYKTEREKMSKIGLDKLCL